MKDTRGGCPGLGQALVSTRRRDFAGSVAVLLNLPPHAAHSSVVPGQALVSTRRRDFAGSVAVLLNLPPHAAHSSVVPG